jgi:hypothetical protein
VPAEPAIIHALSCESFQSHPVHHGVRSKPCIAAEPLQRRPAEATAGNRVRNVSAVTGLTSTAAHLGDLLRSGAKSATMPLAGSSSPADAPSKAAVCRMENTGSSATAPASASSSRPAGRRHHRRQQLSLGPKSLAVEAVSEAVSAEAASPLAKQKKDELVAQAEAQLAGKRWLPGRAAMTRTGPLGHCWAIAIDEAHANALKATH